MVAVLVEMHEACLGHDPGAGHPEAPSRLAAVEAGIARAGMDGDVAWASPAPAARADLLRVHHADYLDAVASFCAAGGGELDADTVATAASWDAALVAAGSGIDAVARLRAGEADAAFVAVRPPGHHATATRAMGFCLLNNVAVVAAHLAADEERVLVVDIDAHHGNGTQEVFWSDPRVTYLSLHEWPLYPGTGRLTDIGGGPGRGTTVNLPVPAGTTGDVYLAALDTVVAPLAERVRPGWLVISAGFDGHRADPLTDLGLSAGDYATMIGRLSALVPAGRRLVVLEGGYDLEALAACTQGALRALAGDPLQPEPSTNGGPGRDVVDAVRQLHDL